MIPYETLVRSPDDTFAGLLSFLGFSLDTEEKKASFRKAQNSTSVESLKNIETVMGGALARDQLDRGESHLRSVSPVQPIFDAIEQIAAHCDG